jgi:amicoumacin kinase
MIHYATLDEAQKSLNEWNGQAKTVKHIGDFGNSVYEYISNEGIKRILRFTDAQFRRIEEVKAELAYIKHLESQNVPCAVPILSKNNEWVKVLKSQNKTLIGASFTYAEGHIIDENSPVWGAHFFKQWGRNLAAIHAASRTYQYKDFKLWEWHDEILFKQADQLIPTTDSISRQEWADLQKILSNFPKNQQTYGIIHADHAPQNFHYLLPTEHITVFDFGNSCYHWYLADVANALSTVRFKKDKDIIWENIISGYAESENLPEDFQKQISIFLRLRILYVYLDRLYLFGKNPNLEQQNTLAILSKKVHNARSGVFYF